MLGSLSKAFVASCLSCEIIVVDNNSNDDTHSVFEQIEHLYKSPIKYIFEKKTGLSHARNRGIREAKGNVIAFTDDDVLVDRNWVMSLHNAYKQHDGVACVGGKILPVWETPKPDWLKPGLYPYFALLDYGDSFIYLDKPDVWGANISFASAMFHKYGLFDTNLGRRPGKLYTCEETEFLYRLQKAGEKILYSPASIVHHVIPSHRMTKKYLRKWAFDQGEFEGIFMGESKYLSVLDTRPRGTRTLLRHFLASMANLCCCTRDRVHNEMHTCRDLGVLAGTLKRKLKREQRAACLPV